MPYTNEVIRYFRRKDASGFNEPISWLGSEQRFVGPLRNSNVNNLEEQYTFGTDTYTVYTEDLEGNTVIEKNFCSTNGHLEDTTNYYRVVTTIYANPITKSDIAFVNSSVELTDKYDDVVFGDASTQYSDPHSLYFLDADKYSFDETTGNVQMVCNNISEFTEIRKDELYFIKENEEILVLTKTTEQQVLDDNKTIIVRKNIINHLRT